MIEETQFKKEGSSNGGCPAEVERPKLKVVCYTEEGVRQMVDKLPQRKHGQPKGNHDEEESREDKPKQKHKKGKSKKHKNAEESREASPAQPKQHKKEKPKKKSKEHDPVAIPVESSNTTSTRLSPKKEKKAPANLPKANQPLAVCKQVICQLCEDLIPSSQDLVKHDAVCHARSVLCYDCKECLPHIIYDQHLDFCPKYLQRKEKEKEMTQKYKDAINYYDNLEKNCSCLKCKPPQPCKPPTVVPSPPNVGYASQPQPRPPGPISVPPSPFGVPMFYSLYPMSQPRSQAQLLEQERQRLMALRTAPISPPIRANTAPVLPSQESRSTAQCIPRECTAKVARAADPIFEDYKTYNKEREKLELRLRIVDHLPRRQYVPRNFEEDDCGICCIKMRLQDQLIELKCHHMLHIPCVADWLMRDDRCPLCMKPTV